MNKQLKTKIDDVVQIMTLMPMRQFCNIYTTSEHSPAEMLLADIYLHMLGFEIKDYTDRKIEVRKFKVFSESLQNDLEIRDK
jgi:phage antirepressor YoqD-like protein